MLIYFEDFQNVKLFVFGNVIICWFLQNIRERESSHMSESIIIQHKSLEVVCSVDFTFFSWFGTGVSFEDQKLVYSMSFQMNRQQISRASRSYVGWMRGMLVYDTSLSQNMCRLACSHEPQGKKSNESYYVVMIRVFQYSTVLLLNPPPEWKHPHQIGITQDFI